MEQKFKEWTIKKCIGGGAFGKVYLIEREEFNNVYRAALKVIEVPQNPDDLKMATNDGMSEENVTEYFYGMVERIVDEFTLMSKLKGNSNIVSYEDHFVEKKKDGFGWIVYIRMEYLTPLYEHISEKKLTVKDVIKLGIDICHALEICQKYNIIHRDIKPENIFISDIGDFKLGDFGIARELEKTSAGLSRVGTIGYMAPEVFTGLEYNSTVDIYSLGVVMYRFLNQNRMPFMPPAPEKISFADKEKANRLRLSGQEMPKPCNAEGRLAKIILKACAYDPKNRYESASDMKRALEKILYTEGEKEIIYPRGDVLENSAVEYAGRIPWEQKTETQKEVKSRRSDEGTVYLFGQNERKNVVANQNAGDREEQSLIKPGQAVEVSSFMGVNLGMEESEAGLWDKADSMKPKEEESSSQVNPEKEVQVAEEKEKSSLDKAIEVKDEKQGDKKDGNIEPEREDVRKQRQDEQLENWRKDIEAEAEQGGSEEINGRIHADRENQRKRKIWIAGSVLAAVLIGLVVWMVSGQENILDRSVGTEVAGVASTLTPKSTSLPTSTSVPKPTPTPVSYRSLRGKKISFGRYWQRDTNEDGVANKHDAKEPIRWLVLDIEEGTGYHYALLLSEKILDVVQYNKTNTYITWEKSLLRKWLKKEFYPVAFNKKEKRAIQKRIISNPDDSGSKLKGGGDTKDYVFALSGNEYWNKFSAWSEYFKEETKIGKSTKYASAKEKRNFGYTIDGWWLRSSGKKGYPGQGIRKDWDNPEMAANYYWKVDVVDMGVRPALYLDLTKSSWKKIGK